MPRTLVHSCQVDVNNRQKEVVLPLAKKDVVRIVHEVLIQQQHDGDFVSIHFISDTMMRKYHAEFFQDSSSTDCISFPIHATGSPKILGDVFVCPKTAELYAAQHQLPIAQELTLYIVHGMLHLLGYEDHSVSARREMRQQEAAVMARLFSA